MSELGVGVRWATAILAAGVSSMLSGCAAVTPPASTTSCSAFTSVLPVSATANHAAISPGNQAQFVMGTGNFCNALLARDYPSWTNPDPLDIQISAAADNTNGTVTCKGPTAGAVTLSATATVNGATVVENVVMTCQ